MMRQTGVYKVSVSLLVFASMMIFQLAITQAAPLSDGDIKITREALKLSDKKRWEEALERAVKASSPLPAKFIRWQQLQDPAKNGLRFADFASFMAHNPDWPRQRTLQARAEESITDAMAADKILSWFDNRTSVTADGAIRLSQALIAQGRTDEAIAHIRRTWLESNFGRAQQRTFYRTFREHLTADDHVQRLERLVWEGRYYPARRMLNLVNPDVRKLAEARLALRKMKGGVDGAIARVPAELRNHQGLVFERMRWRRIKGRDMSARELLFAEGPSPDEVVYAGRWWHERAILARRAIRNGHFSEAYRIIKDHGLTSGADFAEAEWLAGWVQLRFMLEPQIAYMHFQRMYNAVSFPISKSRGAYWTARALEKAGKANEAIEWYTTAAAYPTTYYGQHAAGRIGKIVKIRTTNDVKPTDQETADFMAHELVQVTLMLEQVERQDLMRSVLFQLNEMSQTAAWRVLTAQLALKVDRADLAVFAAKKASQKGEGLVLEGYPRLEEVIGKEPEPALVHALIRQESAFYTKAQSHAGARGLMQLIPPTASRVSKQLGLKYTRSRLTEDPVYNVSLGRHYLKTLLERWDGSHVLALASYNAGPSRARQWIREFGDPRKDDPDDVIDWIEQIPFSETRNYVQRVMENAQVYRQRLKAPQLAANSDKTADEQTDHKVTP